MTIYSGSSSIEYNNAEVEVIDWLNTYLSSNGNKITINHKHKYYYNDNQFIELDGYGSDYAIEIYLANDLKGSKIDKVASDILKLSLLPETIKRVFVCRQELKEKLQGKSWISFAIKQNNIDILVPELSAKTMNDLNNANKRNRDSILRT